MTAAAAPTATAARPKGLHIGLWVAQGLLAFAFTGSGVMKLMTPIADLANRMAWVNHFPELAVRGIGLAEWVGAIGLIVPAATRIMPKLTPLAAALLTVLMVGAAATHVVVGEPLPTVVPSVVLGALAAFIAWGRFTKAQVQPR